VTASAIRDSGINFIFENSNCNSCRHDVVKLGDAAHARKREILARH